MAILIHTGKKEASVLEWVLLWVYVLGLLLFVGTRLASGLAKRKILSRILLIASTFLTTPWATYTLVSLVKSRPIYTFISLVKSNPSLALFYIIYVAIVVLFSVFTGSLFLLAILGCLDSCFESEEASEERTNKLL